jgi:hypothetical protein
MRLVLTLVLTSLLAGCVVDSPQKAQYNAEYPHRQDIRRQTVYQFMTKPVTKESKGSDDLAEFFHVREDRATRVELRFNYPAHLVEISALDENRRVLRKTTVALLDESAADPSDREADYFYLTKDGTLLRKSKNCTPDMSVGCRWDVHTAFLTQKGDLAVQYENGSAGLFFLVVPFYGSSKYLNVFPNAFQGV